MKQYLASTTCNTPAYASLSTDLLVSLELWTQALATLELHCIHCRAKVRQRSIGAAWAMCLGRVAQSLLAASQPGESHDDTPSTSGQY